jgi:hypothetical protein
MDRSGRVRTFYLTFAVWHDPFWRANFRRSWKKRRYWLMRPPALHVAGRALALQIGAYTFKITTVGAHRDAPSQREPHG